MTNNLLSNDKEIGEINRKRWIIAGSVILAFVLFLLLFHFRGKEFSPEEIDRKISESKNLKQADQLCDELPKPEDFQFVGKHLSGNSFTSSVSYDYKTSSSSEERQLFYSNLLKANGWTVGKSNLYEKGNKQIAIMSVNFPKANVSIYCAEVYR